MHQQRKHLAHLLAIAGALLLAGCVNFGRVLPDAGPPGEEESIVVLGATTSDFTFILVDATLRDGKLATSGGAVIGGPPKDGYLVGRAKAGTNLALARVANVREDGSEVLGSILWVCDKTLAKTARVPGGKVIYIGDSHVRYRDGGFVMDHDDFFESAKAYIDQNYPKLAGRLENWPTERHPTWATCARPRR